MVDRRGWDRDGENAPSVGREEGRALETQRERESGRRRRLQRRERVPCNDAATRCAVQPY